ncbi:MAG: hypothetical protein HRU18_18745 [Pseudoalteromonas sp.]|uniref:hypothetical protein n=1 Tax=Pseudoalteromonas sp. TaxID=53249 RepID=UPI001D7D9D19|nr:hypothetical protein [Pseudoalteromonas sp.]NRA80245.1 hypothetical protein [Pseudoalteromonas sp.]
MQANIHDLQTQLEKVELALGEEKVESCAELVSELHLMFESYFNSNSDIPYEVYPQLNQAFQKLTEYSSVILAKKNELKNQLTKMVKNKKQVGLYKQIK